MDVHSYKILYNSEHGFIVYKGSLNSISLKISYFINDDAYANFINLKPHNLWKQYIVKTAVCCTPWCVLYCCTRRNPPELQVVLKADSCNDRKSVGWRKSILNLILHLAKPVYLSILLILSPYFFFANPS
jgi:hypothetical protein